MLKVLYRNDDMFASHPANHGRWQWGDEWLFGFLLGKRGQGAYHDTLPPYQKLLMRSLDAGKSWEIETPNVDFDAKYPKPGKPTNGIYRVCGYYDTGGDDCPETGGYYTSEDHGKKWDGPYLFGGLENEFSNGYMNSSRTCQLGEFLFLSSRTEKFGTDWTFCVEPDGDKFKIRSVVCREQGQRAVMPSVCRITDDIVICALRRKKMRYNNSIQIFKSTDNCKTWTSDDMEHNFYTGECNGNPPGMVCIDKTVYCCYANRSKNTLVCLYSIDFGRTWKYEVLDKDIGTDIGYPVMFGTEATGPNVIYYADGKIYQHKF